MREARCEADLVKESFAAECERNFRVHDLERDGAIVSRIGREENGGHSTACDLTLDAVAVTERFLELPHHRRLDNALGRG